MLQSKKQQLINDLYKAANFLRKEQPNCIFTGFDDAAAFADILDKTRHAIEHAGYHPLRLLTSLFYRKTTKMCFILTGDWDTVIAGHDDANNLMLLGMDLFKNL